MKEYLHAFCSLTMKKMGVEEYGKGLQLTCLMFREMFKTIKA